MAQSGHPNTLNQCLLLGVKRTLPKRPLMSAFDPKRDIRSWVLLPRKMTVGTHLLGSLVFLQSEGQGDEQAPK
jgi:hypothetical protein